MLPLTDHLPGWTLWLYDQGDDYLLCTYPGSNLISDWELTSLPAVDGSPNFGHEVAGLVSSVTFGQDPWYNRECSFLNSLSALPPAFYSLQNCSLPLRLHLPSPTPPLVSLCVDLDEGEIGNRGGLRSPEQARCIMRTLPPRILITWSDRSKSFIAPLHGLYF